MSRILIAGCGYVGAATADLFQQQGWEVEGWTASPESAAELSGKPFQIRAVDITKHAAVKDAAVEPFDAVIQSASSRGGGADAYRLVYLAGARNLIAAFPRVPLLFTSSTSVYAQSWDEWVTESSPAEPERETGRILREAEELVLAAGGTVARLAGIYGPGRSALLRKFLAGDAVLDAAGPRVLNQAHRDDIAAALFLLVQQALAGSGNFSERPIYNVADSHPITDRECYEWLTAHLCRPMPPTVDAPAPRKRGNSSKRISSKKLQACGWTPRYPTFAAAMRDSILPNLERLGA
ncbi:MAG: NAD-dependent epimerase/dehydratase family protein [Chthoniobacterales bacterium]|nr:NAD-dependent epimerase/dehydratase family protein [Chthoniobacterales bacterium]